MAFTLAMVCGVVKVSIFMAQALIPVSMSIYFLKIATHLLRLVNEVPLMQVRDLTLWVINEECVIVSTMK